MPRLAESPKIYDLLLDINEKSLKEKGPGRPPFWEMVFWWTRKPLIGARAAILSCLLPEEVDLREFRRMIKLDESLPHRVNPEVFPKYEGYVTGKKLLDPFAGFGSIPLEGLRLGLNVTAVELLPTAYVFLKAVLEYPAKYGKKLIKDVEKWGKWITEELKKDPLIQELYDDDVAVYIGTWEIKCPNCQKWTPLVGNWWLARVKANKGYKRLAFFRYNKEEDVVEIVDFRNKSRNARVNGRRIEVDGRVETVPEPNINARRNTARCLHCGMEIRRSVESGDEWYVKWALKKYNEGDERFARQRLLVKVKVANGDLVFEPADETDNEKLEIAKGKVKELIEKGDPDIPNEELWKYTSGTAGNLSIITWGFDRFYKLFNPRQLLTLVKLVKLIREVGKKVKSEKIAEGWSEEEALNYAEAVATYLGIALCKFFDYNSVVNLWNPGSWSWNKVAHTLSMRGIAMQWNWCEINPSSELPLSYYGTLKNTFNSLNYLVSSLNSSIAREDSEKQIKINLDDATTLTKLQDEKFDLIVTDPPYRDDVPYTELSDFYYVWLKRALSDSDGKKLLPRFHKEAFFKKVGAKYIEIETQWQEFAKREISYNVGRYGNSELALRSYKDLFVEALKAMKERIKEDGIIALYFAHSKFEAWAELLEALMSAGLKVTNAFPLATESKDRVTGKGKLTMDTSLLVTCRPSQGGEILLSNLRPSIEENARKMAKHLAGKGIPGRDVLIGTMIAAIKPATEYSRILTPAGPVSIKDLLEKEVYPIVGRVLAEVYGARTGEKIELRDPFALFYLLAKICFGWKGGTRPFTGDDVVTLCRASMLSSNDARLLITEARASGGEEEEFEISGSSVAASKTVKLIEITDTQPEKIRQLLAKKKLPLTEPRPRNAVDAYHYLLYFAAQYPSERVKEEYRNLVERFPFAEEAYKLAKIVARMEDGAEVVLSRKLVQAIEGIEGFESKFLG